MASVTKDVFNVINPEILENQIKCMLFCYYLMKLGSSTVKNNRVFSDIEEFGKPQCKQEAIYSVALVVETCHWWFLSIVYSQQITNLYH